MSVILGTKEATLQPLKFGWSSERGHYSTRSYEGGEAQIKALIPQIIATGASYDCEQMSGDLWRIVATSAQPDPAGAGGGNSGGDEIAVTWELLPKDVQKQLVSSNHSLVSALTQTELEDAIRDSEDGLCGAISAPAIPGGRVTKLTGNPLKLLKLLKAKVDTVEVEQPVLNLTWIVPGNVNLAYSYAKIGRIYTTASLISTESIPGYISSAMVLWTASFTNPTYGTNRISLVFGWKKRAPTQRLAGRNRREINQTWEFGLWATDIYGATV